MATTPKWALRYPIGGDAPDVPLWMERLATDLDGVAMDSQGILSARPTSSGGTPGTEGRYYFAEDDYSGGATGTLYRDYGTGWAPVSDKTTAQCEVSSSASGGWSASAVGDDTGTILTYGEVYDLGTPSTNMFTSGSSIYARISGLYHINNFVNFTALSATSAYHFHFSTLNAGGTVLGGTSFDVRMGPGYTGWDTAVRLTAGDDIRTRLIKGTTLVTTSAAGSYAFTIKTRMYRISA